MMFTTESLASYLGQSASTLLTDTPFNDWTYERTVEDDLDELAIAYVFSGTGVSISCDGQNTVSTIFLENDNRHSSNAELADIPFSSSRKRVIVRFGTPERSGARHEDPVLGDYGDWDRFQTPRYTIHFEYLLDASGIRRITIMRSDVVPQ